MKAKELAEQLLKNPDFDVVFTTVDEGDVFWPNVRRFENIDINDIGYSDKVIILGGEEV